MSEIQALCDVTHIVNGISYTVDDMPYIIFTKDDITTLCVHDTTLGICMTSFAL